METAYGKLINTYQVLIEGEWQTVNPNLPLSEQTCGMRGYRILDSRGVIVKQSNIRGVESGPFMFGS